MTSNENERLARIETKLDTLIKVVESREDHDTRITKLETTLKMVWAAVGAAAGVAAFGVSVALQLVKIGG